MKSKEKLQKKFLKKLYKNEGCADVSWIASSFYGMDQDMLMQNIICDLIEDGKCVVEDMPGQNGGTHPVVFITMLGLDKIKGADKSDKWSIQNLTYEKRCHGYTSVAEYFENEQEHIDFYKKVTQVFCRGMMYVSMMKEEQYRMECETLLKDGKELMEERCKKEDFSSEIHITVLRTIIDKLIEDQDQDYFEKEVSEAEAILSEIENQRFRVSEEYRWYVR